MCQSLPAAPPFFCLDVLVLGSGLAGLRAAWAALERAPGTTVAVVSPRQGSSGSSFANQNDRLGLHVPRGPAEEADFVAEVTALAGQGSIREELVRILAREAGERYAELFDLGLSFLCDGAGEPLRFPSCFSPRSRRAVIFHDLAAAYDALYKKVSSLGGGFLHGFRAVGLLQEAPGSRVLGAVLVDDAGSVRPQPARAVIAAMGGPAPLFGRNIAGPGNPGYGHGLLAEAGAAMANTTFIQWMWGRVDGGAFWPVWSLLEGGSRLLDVEGRIVPIPDTLCAVAARRAEHCPVGNGLPDAALDAFVLARADTRGEVTIEAPGEGRFRVTLWAQAGNGGAVIDAEARTAVPGLFAAGECATGMHGANRVGGAMVAACLVFGAIAGASAVCEPDGVVPSLERFGAVWVDRQRYLRFDAAERERVRRELAGALPRQFFPMLPGGPSVAGPATWRQRLDAASDVEARLLLKTALLLGGDEAVAGWGRKPVVSPAVGRS